MDDFNTVLRLTSGTFDKALLMQAKIQAKEAKWPEAKALIKTYTKKVGNGDKDAQDLVSQILHYSQVVIPDVSQLFSISEGEVATKKAQQASKAKKYEECIEQATNALATASHAIWIRELRSACALASGDVEQAIGDMMYVVYMLSLLYSLTSVS